MKDKELKLNASGYKDEPCYKTIKAVDAPKPGEIYIHGDTGRYVLVLNCVNGVCAILNLTEQEREDRIPVMVRVKMYTNTIMITYAFTSALAQYVKTISQAEFTDVRDAVTRALGLEKLPLSTESGVNEEYVVRLKDNISALEAKVMVLKEENERLFKETGTAHKEMMQMTDARDKAEAERDAALTVADQIHAENIDASIQLEKEKAKSQFYREMYDTLLDKVISARGCANE